MKSKVLNLLEGIHDGSLQLARLNYAHVVLVPKRGEACEVGDFIPISVLNASVKIISKVLTDRPRDVLEEFIGDHQTGLIKG